MARFSPPGGLSDLTRDAHLQGGAYLFVPSITAIKKVLAAEP